MYSSIAYTAPVLLECGNLLFRAVQRIPDLLPRSAQECRTVAGWIMLEDANDVYESIEIAQMENPGRLVGIAECISRRCLDHRGCPTQRCFANRTNSIPHYDSDCILDKGIPDPDWQPTFEYISICQILVHGENQAMLGFVGVARE